MTTKTGEFAVLDLRRCARRRGSPRRAAWNRRADDRVLTDRWNAQFQLLHHKGFEPLRWTRALESYAAIYFPCIAQWSCTVTAWGGPYAQLGTHVRLRTDRQTADRHREGDRGVHPAAQGGSAELLGAVSVSQREIAVVLGACS